MKREARRTTFQAVYAALTNSYAAGFLQGGIYTGPLKAYCVPGLNCYSCPGALGACPVGSLQAALGGHARGIPFYTLGFLLAFAALFGRFVCGFLCPFGLVQDLLHKIPFSKKQKRLPGEKLLRYLRYVILALFVVLLPMFALDAFSQGIPWFCKYICPSGTLFGGIPLTLVDERLRAITGGLFTWKISLLITLLVLSVIVYRPFCRYLCPLGAIYGVYNPIALLRYEIDTGACISCDACTKACPFSIPTYRQPNSPDCIRCGRCKSACPTGAIHTRSPARRAAQPHGAKES